MNQEQIISELQKNHQSFIAYLNALSEEAFNFKYLDKWTAGQQLAHIVLCVKPLVTVFGLERTMLEQKFGKLNRAGLSFDQLLAAYLEKFTEGGKAPENYVPEEITFEKRAVLIQNLEELISELCRKLSHFTEDDLDSLCIPHPLLGMLSLREMLYNAIYHVEHHHKAAIRNLQYQSIA
ncbi:MAG: DinB family protein [Saprospiraceae bacterium]